MSYAEDSIERMINGEVHCGYVSKTNPPAVKNRPAYPYGPCPHCGGEVRAGDASEIHPNRRPAGIYICQKCRAYVGCHDGYGPPLGTVADKETRSWRKIAHLAFDAFWEGDAGISRSSAYSALAFQLGIEKRWCHIAMFNVSLCKQVTALRWPFLKGTLK